MQRVGSVGLQACYFVGFLGGYPLCNNISVLVDDLDLRAFELLAVCDVSLADFDRCIILVFELRDLVASVILDIHCQDSVVQISDRYFDILLRFVEGVTLLILYLFLNRVLVCTGLFVLNRVECDISFGIIADRLDLLIFLVVQLKAELLVVQFSVLKCLMSFENYGSSRLIFIGESCASFFTIIRCTCQCTIEIILHLYFDLLLICIEGVAALVLIFFFDGVVISSGLSVCDLVKCNLALSIVLLGLQQFASLVKFKAELFRLKNLSGLTLQFLMGFELNITCS